MHLVHQYFVINVTNTLVEHLTTWVPVEHRRDKPIIRMQIFYVLAKRTQVSLCYIINEILY